jgi:two-component system, OmpR family, sensor histidine kinase KdpD
MENRRGNYKIFLGMAAGVGKTYRMLQEARAEAEAGRDVVIGYLEPHERPETMVLARGLELVPRRRVPYGDTLVPEMDLPAVLTRRAELCLIDELAHTNPAGLDHEKRYEDIEDVLASGSDVFSTVNVQHLESLNDQVADLTGVRVRETFPDSVLSSADEVVLIDLTPRALIQRLREGKVYPPERVETALNNFFKVENLAALREVALRQVAENVESKRIVREVVGTREDRVAGAAPQAVGERLLALITPAPSSQRLVRRAWRSAQRLGAELDVLYVGNDGEDLRPLRKLASVLGAHFIVEPGDNVAEVVERVAQQRGTTYVLLGRPHDSGGLMGRLREPLVLQLMRRMPGVDVRVVADRAERRTEEEL